MYHTDLLWINWFQQVIDGIEKDWRANPGSFVTKMIWDSDHLSGFPT